MDPTPPDLAEVWQAYIARFSIEHTFRFFKQTLHWTTPKLRSPHAADRWTWLLILAYVQLRFARDAVTDVRLPGSRRCQPSDAPPPGSDAAFRTLLPRLGSPVSGQNPADARPGVPRQALSACSSASQRSN